MPIARKSALTRAVLVLAATLGSPVQAQSFGTTTFAQSIFSFVDSDGQHHPGNTCDTSVGVCNTSMPYASASALTALGASSGRVVVDSIGRGGAGGALVTSYWWDTFTITSSTLPNGTFVTVEAHIDLDAIAVPSLAAPSPYTRGQAGITYGGPDAPAVAFAGTHSPFALSSTGTFG